MTRLLVESSQLSGDVITVAGEEHRYLTRVLRVELGDHVVLFDGKNQEAEAQVTRIGPRALELKVIERRSAVVPDRPAVTLIQGLTKGDKFDLVVQKATELGVSRIIPVSSTRAVIRPELGRALARQVRWQKIAREASRQSGRIDIPEVTPIVPLQQALSESSPQSLRILLWEGARGKSLRTVLPAAAQAPDPTAAAAATPTMDKSQAVTLAVGPEGGFSNEEVADAERLGFVISGLGPRILRTETAPLVALAILGYVIGDLG